MSNGDQGIKQACPLCGAGAAFEFYNDPRCKHFDCPTCVEFCIDEYAERHIAEMPEFRATASARARLSDATRLYVIRARMKEEMQDQGNFEGLVAKFIAR
jgi:hypothetical protein